MKTEIVFVLDRSGSMSGLEEDTIGGFNSMLKKQKSETGEANVTTILFDDKYQILHDHLNIKGIKPITKDEYYVGGSTALLDAMGRTINKIINIIKNTSENERADKVIFIVITDGMENSSHEYNGQMIRKMVQYEEKAYGWEFIFLGANIDAFATAQSFGFRKEHISNYCPDGAGTVLNYEVLSNAIGQVRCGKSISDDWNQKINEDYKKRGK